MFWVDRFSAHLRWEVVEGNKFKKKNKNNIRCWRRGDYIRTTVGTWLCLTVWGCLNCLPILSTIFHQVCYNTVTQCTRFYYYYYFCQSGGQWVQSESEGCSLWREQLLPGCWHTPLPVQQLQYSLTAISNIDHCTSVLSNPFVCLRFQHCCYTI